jgi:transcription initiation factor IIE alpha subunit
MWFVQCSSCGAPITAVDYNDTETLLKNHEKKIDRLQREVEIIGHNLVQLINYFNQRR